MEQVCNERSESESETEREQTLTGAERGSAAGASVILADCSASLDEYYTKWRWDGAWICSGLGRCWGVQAQEAGNGATLGLTTTGNAEWVTPQ